MTELTVLLDQLAAPVPGGIGRYAEELTRALLATATPSDAVHGLVSRGGSSAVRRALPELEGLRELRTPAPLTARLWARGLGAPRRGAYPLHSPSILGPLVRAVRQHPVVTTIHDAVPWTHPETLTPHGARWHRRMGERAARYADAVIVPTQAVAEELGRHLSLGDRVHVVGGAVGTRLSRVAARDGDIPDLPERFLLFVGTIEPRKGLEIALRTMRDPRLRGVALVVVGPRGWGELPAELSGAGAPAGVVWAGRVADERLAAIYARAEALLLPSLEEGFGLPLLEAGFFGTPSVHSDSPALVEVAGGAGVTVAGRSTAGFAEAFAEATVSLLGDAPRRESLAEAARRRAQEFGWEQSARRVWALHHALG